MASFSKLIFGERNRIGRRLIVLIVAFSSLITLCISIVQLTLEYRELRNDVENVLDGVGIHIPSVAGSVWDFDEKQIQLTLSALAQLPNIERISIATTTGRQRWTTGKIVSSRVATRTYALRHQDRGKEAEIGTLEAAVSLDAVDRKIVARAITIVSSNALKTFFVAVFMMILFRRVVTRRLGKLGQKVTDLVPGALPVPLVHSAQAMPRNLDELDAVAWTLDHTAEELATAVEALKDLNGELQQRVVEQDVILQNALVGILMVRNGVIVSCNRRLEEIFGYPAGGMNGLRTRVLYPTEEVYASFREKAVGALGQGLSVSDTLTQLKRDGTPIWIEMSGRALDPLRPRDASIWICSDVTERKAAEDQVKFIAFHDALTGLPNRLLVQDRLQQSMAGADRSKAKIALLVLDLDNFKTINDTLGHSIGDGVLREVARRLGECVRDTDTVCRQGGDEFVILLPSLPDAEATAPILVKLMERLIDPCRVEGHELTTSVSIGVAVYPDDGQDLETLMKKADLAMYRAKDAGRNTYRFFDQQMNIDAIEQLSMRNGLRRALERGEFVLHYQPQIDLAGNTVIGVEALIRWNHPDLGMIPPARFIPGAEDSGLIIPISEWVLREACRQAAAWVKSGLPPILVAVNLSAVQFKRSDVEQSVISALEESGIDPSLLELELTESILITDTETVLDMVKRLKQLGVKLSIDDFGTGYSSLSYLKRFQVNKLKIDQSFVRDLATDQEDAAIVGAIIQMAHSLGLIVIAEGVETELILGQLRSFGCDEAQGYYFARPMPAEEVAAFRLRMNSAAKDGAAGH
jgi:diguanylate cyclase (GGDEF)-like protein/PAS domain S-box-containing protein